MFYFYGGLVVLIGLLIGSFLNCLIWRLYREESLNGRSYCPKCRHQISWYDNIPVFSFIFLKGQCRHCHQKISWQYPIVEAATALIFLLIFLKDLNHPQLTLILIRDWLVAITLIIVFVYDWRWQLVPMLVIWPMTALIFILNLLLGILWWKLLLLAALVVAFFLIQYLITKRRGLGEGDIWLGLFLGVTFSTGGELLLIAVTAYGLGAIISIILLSQRRKSWKSKIALGPFLAFGAIITLIWGSALINWYLGLF